MKRLFFGIATASIACAALVHCGDDTSSSPSADSGTTTPPTPGPTTTPTPPHPPPPSSNDGGDAGEDATVVTTQGPDGVVEVASYGFNKPSPQSGWSMLASFSHPSGAGYTLTTTTIGACKVRVQSAPATVGTQDSAGDVTLSQAATTLATATFTGSGYTVDGGSTAMPLIPGSGSFHIAAAGATVPAFAVDIDAPYGATLLDPDLPDSGPLVVDRSKDLALSWTGGTSATLVLLFFGADNGLTQLRCELDGSAGSGTIPKAALAKLPAGSGGFSAFTRQGTTLDAGGRPVDVSMTFASTSRDLREYQAILAQYN